MRNITMTMNAASCVASARLRQASILLATNRVGDQGTGVSIVAPIGVRVADRAFTGHVPFAAVDHLATNKTPDVARSRSGRPPV
ncbi:hypothetical protein [Intrasporangium sp.]|uniref:hypothetical protein n=1 Tax=Intrasporangium sp. TaxID=1925024 RepID=UPI00293A9662|nr:hypothetical protein [Intrasporangium sp.]MDV3223012.1 hypothetical protein [Intrasporangium sp.]